MIKSFLNSKDYPDIFCITFWETKDLRSWLEGTILGLAVASSSKLWMKSFHHKFTPYTKPIHTSSLALSPASPLLLLNWTKGVLRFRRELASSLSTWLRTCWLYPPLKVKFIAGYSKLEIMFVTWLMILQPGLNHSNLPALDPKVSLYRDLEL